MKPYQLRCDTILDDTGKSHIGYGIGHTSGDISVKDIFCNKKEAEAFIKLCNDFDLSPLHLHDVIQDVL